MRAHLRNDLRSARRALPVYYTRWTGLHYSFYASASSFPLPDPCLPNMPIPYCRSNRSTYSVLRVALRYCARVAQLSCPTYLDVNLSRAAVIFVTMYDVGVEWRRRFVSDASGLTTSGVRRGTAGSGRAVAGTGDLGGGGGRSHRGR